MPGPILVERSHGEEIGNVDADHEVASLGNEFLQSRDGSCIQGCLTVWIDWRGHSADEKALKMRVLAAKNRMHLDELSLPVQRFEVVRHGHKVRLGWEAIGGMAPVRVRKWAELTAI